MDKTINILQVRCSHRNDCKSVKSMMFLWGLHYWCNFWNQIYQVQILLNPLRSVMFKYSVEKHKFSLGWVIGTRLENCYGFVITAIRNTCTSTIQAFIKGYQKTIKDDMARPSYKNHCQISTFKNRHVKQSQSLADEGYRV